MHHIPSLQLSIENTVATLTINRPQALNALNEELLHDLKQTLQELSEKPFDEVRVLLVRGAGEKAFVAGADIKFMQTAPTPDIERFTKLGQEVMHQLEALPFVSVAVVDGFAIGGGLELALSCDLIVASSKAKLGQAEVNLGLIPGFGGTQRLFWRAGAGAARRLIFTAENIPAQEAHRLGVVDWVYGPEELEEGVQSLLRTLLSKGPVALAASKRAMQAAFRQQLTAGLEAEIREFVGLFDFEDTKEGLSAFVEKRKPEFKGR